MSQDQKIKIIRICATVADLYFSGDLPTCSRTDCERRQTITPPKQTGKLREQIRELLAEISHLSLQEEQAAYRSIPHETGTAHQTTALEDLVRDYQRQFRTTDSDG